jgi:hypothetical protein
MFELNIASMMLCTEPKSFNGRLFLSGCDSVWNAVQEIPDELKEYFTDEIGNGFVQYGGFL